MPQRVANRKSRAELFLESVLLLSHHSEYAAGNGTAVNVQFTCSDPIVAVNYLERKLGTNSGLPVAIRGTIENLW